MARMNKQNMGLLEQLTGRDPGAGKNISGNAMIQQLSQQDGAEATPFGGRRKAMQGLAQQNGLSDPNGGKFRNREILQQLLAKQQAPAPATQVDPIAVPPSGTPPVTAVGGPAPVGGVQLGGGQVNLPPANPGSMAGGNVRPLPALGGGPAPAANVGLGSGVAGVGVASDPNAPPPSKPVDAVGGPAQAPNAALIPPLGGRGNQPVQGGPEQVGLAPQQPYGPAVQQKRGLGQMLNSPMVGQNPLQKQKMPLF